MKHIHANALILLIERTVLSVSKNVIIMLIINQEF
jgi:hypothetical protein